MRKLSSLERQVVLLADRHVVHSIHLHLAVLRTEGVAVAVLRTEGVAVVAAAVGAADHHEI